MPTEPSRAGSGSFFTTNLADKLRERDVDTLILAGVSTSGCVLSTVLEASDRSTAAFGYYAPLAARLADTRATAALSEQLAAGWRDLDLLGDLRAAVLGRAAPPHPHHTA